MSGHNAPQQMFDGPLRVADPGASGTIVIDRFGALVPIVTATAESRTLAAPTREGILATIVLHTDGGNMTLTVTNGYDSNGNTSLTFADAGDFVTFKSIQVGATYYWRIEASGGVNVADGEDLMAPSSVIDALIEQYVSSVRREGNLIKTEILIDLTGAKSVATDKDIIGNTGICHFGQITTAINGTIVCGQMTCLEVPAGGADDIDLYMASVGTGAYDADGSGLTNAASLITKGGAWALSAPGAATAMTAPVTADYYLYLLSGEAAAGTYTAGKFLIELWGLPA